MHMQKTSADENISSVTVKGASAPITDKVVVHICDIALQKMQISVKFIHLNTGLNIYTLDYICRAICKVNAW